MEEKPKKKSTSFQEISKPLRRKIMTNTVSQKTEDMLDQTFQNFDPRQTSITIYEEPVKKSFLQKLFSGFTKEEKIVVHEDKVNREELLQSELREIREQIEELKETNISLRKRVLDLVEDNKKIELMIVSESEYDKEILLYTRFLISSYKKTSNEYEKLDIRNLSVGEILEFVQKTFLKTGEYTDFKTIESYMTTLENLTQKKKERAKLMDSLVWKIKTTGGKE